jgi:hypothetical protein
MLVPIVGMMHCTIRISTAIGVVLCVAAGTAAQTTRPASDAPSPLAWQQTVATFAAAVASHDADPVRQVISDNCVVRRFLSGRDRDLEPLIEFSAGPTLLGEHAYIGPSSAAANDISADVVASGAVPEDAKKWLDLSDSSGPAVAAQWIARTLAANHNTPVGLIVLWNGSAGRDERRRLVFILLKGEQSEQKFNITEVVYGDPL